MNLAFQKIKKNMVVHSGLENKKQGDKSMSEMRFPPECEEHIREIVHEWAKKSRPKPSINVYVDMDGTLVDFVKKVNKLNFWRDENKEKVDWKKVKAMGPKFWSEMDWIEGAEDGFKKLQDMEDNGLFNLYILSSIDFEDGRIGKKEWIKSHTNFPLEKVIFVQEPEDKANYAGSKNILIDDRNKSLRPFSEAGGYSIKFSILDDWNLIIQKISILTDKLMLKMTSTLYKVSSNGFDYEITETIRRDDLRVVEIKNITNNETEITLIHLPFFYKCYQEVAKYYKDIEKSKVVIAGIEDFEIHPDNFIMCGTPYLQYQGCIEMCKYFDLCKKISANYSFEQLVYSCFSTLISTCKSKQKFQLNEFKKEIRKNDQTNNFIIGKTADLFQDLIKNFTDFIEDYKDGLGKDITQLKYKKAILVVLSSQEVQDSELCTFENTVSEKINFPICSYSLKIDAKICQNYCYTFIFNIDDDYNFYLL